MHSMVANGFNTTSASSSRIGSWDANASWEASFPFPRICGNGAETSPTSPSPTSGMKIRCRFVGLFRSAHVMSLTYATENTPATGPAKSAQTTAGAELAYAGMGYVGASGRMIHATAVATAEATSAGST